VRAFSASVSTCNHSRHVLIKIAGAWGGDTRGRTGRNRTYRGGDWAVWGVEVRPIGPVRIDSGQLT